MKSKIPLRLWLMIVFFLPLAASAATHYVDANGTNSVSPYTSWATAATNIQDAINHAGFGDTILVTNGIYQFGGDSVGDSNRVDDITGLPIQSVNGPLVTTILGYQLPGTTNGVNAVRCVNLREFSMMSGFTISNGATTTSGNGGGVQMASSTTLSNCIVINNTAGSGAGIYSVNNALVINCKIIGNVALANGSTGGGAQGSSGNMIFVNCVFSGNQCNYRGGAAYGSVLVNCTIVGNNGGVDGLDSCKLTNCIAYYNAYDDGEGSGDNNIFNTCCLGSLPYFGNNIITNPPLFVNTNGDYHLMPASPCVNAGTNSIVTTATDLDGNPRIVNGTVDLGAYESPYNTGVHYVSLASTNPVSPFNDWSIAATNIQDAIDAAVKGDVVTVSNGIYASGSRAVYGSQAFRVAITKAITVQSLNGPATVTILGPVAAAMPGVYLTNGATLSGFMISNCAAASASGGIFSQNGGGVWCESSNAVVTNCWLIYNRAPQNGGGAFRGTLLNCVLTSNSAEFGGGAYSNVLVNCTLQGNMSTFSSTGGTGGGGAALSWLSNCVLVANTAINSVGGGASLSTLNNCVLSNNFATFGGGAAFGVINNSLISSNRVSSYGGGAYSNTLNNCTVQNNYAAGIGGGSRYGALNNCVINNNGAPFGGGAASNILNSCLVISNTASSVGGGIYQSLANNCLIIGNVSTNYGGGAYSSRLNNCTIVANTSHTTGGGASQSTLNNCIVYYNADISGTNDVEANYEYWNGARNYCCSAPVPDGYNTYNHFMVTNDPALVDWANGNFHLQSTSPCINSGNNAYVTNSTDYDGNPRIKGGTVDIGAYEYQTPASIISYAYLQQYGLPTDGSVDYADLDGTSFNVYQDWIAGLNPTDPSSILAMSSALSTNAPGITVTWQSVNTRTYYLQRNSDLTMPFTSIVSNIVGQAGTTSYTDNSATNNVPYFYRVGVQ